MFSALPLPARIASTVTTSLFTLVLAAALAPSLKAQDDPGKPPAYVDDWTHHRLVYSNPGTREEAERKGRLDQWLKITGDTRFQLQQFKRSGGPRQVGGHLGDGGGLGLGWNHGGGGGRTPYKKFTDLMEKDWSTPLGSGATASQKGSFSATPSGTGSITIVNGANTLTLTTNASASSVSGAFYYPLISGSTITITSGTNTLSMTSAGTNYAMIGSEPGNNGGPTISTTTIAGQQYTWESNCGGASYCITRSGTLSTDATNLANAIGGNCGGYGTCNTNANVSAVASGAYVFLVNTSTINSQNLSASGASNVTFNSGTIPAASTNACSVGSGTFAPSTSANTLATNLKNALNLCPAGAGLGTTISSTNTVTVKASVLGGSTFSAFSVGGATLTTPVTLFAWNLPVTNGGPGSNACTTPYTAGTFAISTSTTTLAQNLSSVITTCNNGRTATGVTGSNIGNQVTLTSDSAGAAANDITLTSTLTGFTWTSSSLSGGATATVQPNASPAKYGPSLTTASCTADFVVYPTGQPGSATAASIIAYSNIYSSCGGNVPTTYWAFNTESGANTGYTVTTSPTLSYDGSKIAFVQSNGTASELVVLKWIGASGTLTAPTAPTISADIATCTAPCMTVTLLTNNDTYSSPYYAYYSVDDSILVGDDSGSLEEFNNVFSGAISGPQTINLGNTYPLASPVYDLVSGCVFVGDTRGYLYSVNSGTPGTVCTATSFSTRGHTELLSDGGAGGGIYDAPLVDSASGAVYAFVASSAASTTTVTANEGFHSTTLAGTGGAGGTFTTAEDGKAISGTNIPTGDTITATGVNTGTNRATLTTAANCFGGTCGPYTFTITIANGGFNSVDQFATGTIGAGSTTAVPVATQEVGTGGDGYPLFAGTLDNVYYGSTNEASPSGNLYVVGNTGVTTGATLYRLPITTGTLGTPSTAVTGLTPSGAGDYPWPSPLTEFCNGACTVAGGATTGGTDYIFFSVNQGNVPGLCTGGAGNTCIESYSVNSPATILIQGAQSYANPTTNGCWGTGGIVIDNDDTSTTGASEIYFISLAGATAGGGAGGGTATSTNCTTGGAPTINAIQAQQQNP
jgi:hypothetical protein